MKRFFILAIALTVVLSGCGEPEPIACSEQYPEFSEALQDLLIEWSDAVTIVENTPRGTVLGPISDLQEIRRDVQKLEAPPCGEEAQMAVVAYMDRLTEHFIEFANDELPEHLPTLMNKRFREISETEEKALSEIEKLSKVPRE